MSENENSSQGERSRVGRIREAEALIRYAAGLPARDAEDREAYAEWRQLDAESPSFAREGRRWTPDLTDEEIHTRAEAIISAEDARAAEPWPVLPPGEPPF